MINIFNPVIFCTLILDGVLIYMLYKYRKGNKEN